MKLYCITLKNVDELGLTPKINDQVSIQSLVLPLKSSWREHGTLIQLPLCLALVF